MLINVILVALGFLTATVVFLIAAVVVLMLKVKGYSVIGRQFEEVYRAISDQENTVSGRFDEVYRSISDQETETQHKIDDVYRSITERETETQHKIDDVYRSMGEKNESYLKVAQSYTDSRFDKAAQAGK